MIEMLGVLAIIGVLSVGGIAGYSKAMMKFKINKTIDQVSQIVANTRTLYSSQRSYRGLTCFSSSQLSKICKKAHLIPEEMFDNSYDGSLGMTNAFGGEVNLYSQGKYEDDDKAFVLILGNIPEEACIEILTQDWGSSSSSGLIALGSWAVITAYYGCSGSSSNSNDGFFACPGGSNVSVPVPVDVAADYCNGGKSILWKYY